VSTAILNAPASTQKAQDEAAILALIEAVRQAHHAKDPAAIAAPYAPHAVIYDLEPPLSHDGISIERKRKWLDTWQTGVDLETRNLELTIDGSHAFAHGFLRLSGTKKGAERAVDFWMRVTFFFERANGAWRIVHEHHSVPFYMDGSLRPAFDLQP
jgi:ketosteroid isomerase-like protein